MLVLSRRPRQRILIGRNITVTISGIHGNRVKVGVAAPDEIGITRDEEGRPDSRPHKPHEKTEGKLSFTRRVDEGIFIGGDTYVKILKIGRNQVKVGTEAPSDVRIDREELITEGIAHRSKERF